MIRYDEFILTESEEDELKKLREEIKDRDDYEDVKAMIIGISATHLIRVLDENL